jgi:hypothetical protein
MALIATTSELNEEKQIVFKWFKFGITNLQNTSHLILWQYVSLPKIMMIRDKIVCLTTEELWKDRMRKTYI